MDSLDRGLAGVTLVVPTPLKESEEVAYSDIEGLVDWALAKGVTALAVTGTMGEAFRLSDRERVAVVQEFCAAARGKLPVVAGAGHLSTVTAMELGCSLVELGAAALLVPPPPIGATSAGAIEEFFERVVSEVQVPVIVQDDPVHLGFALAPSMIARLAEKHANVRYAKLEELPSPSKIRRVREASGDTVACLGGSGGVYTLEELAAGAAGLMTGFCFPEALVAAREAFRAGSLVEARRLVGLVSHLSRIESLPTVSMALRKHLYWKRGALSSWIVRSPGLGVEDWLVDFAFEELARVDEEWDTLRASGWATQE